LLIPASLGLLVSGVPTVLCPFPAMTVPPMFLLESRAAVFVPFVLFLVWNPQLFRGTAKIPRRSYGLLGVATALSTYWFVVGWQYGLKYQGARYTYLVCAINVVWVAALWAMLTRKLWSTPSFRSNLLLHWALFAWLGWYALPWLGELP
jgi:hypothetical protein